MSVQRGDILITIWEQMQRLDQGSRNSQWQQSTAFRTPKEFPARHAESNKQVEALVNAKQANKPTSHCTPTDVPAVPALPSSSAGCVPTSAIKSGPSHPQTKAWSRKAALWWDLEGRREVLVCGCGQQLVRFLPFYQISFLHLIRSRPTRIRYIPHSQFEHLSTS